MEGKSSKAQGIVPATISASISRLLQREVENSKASPTNVAQDVSESSRLTTLTFSREELLEMIKSLNKEVDPTSVLARIEAAALPPATMQQGSENLQPETRNATVEKERSEGTTIIEEEENIWNEMDGPLEKGEEVEQKLPTMGVEPSSRTEIPEEIPAEPIPMETATVDEPIEEAEQPLLTPEEVTTNLAEKNFEDAENDMEVGENRTAGWNSTERVEIPTDDTLERREVVIVTDEARAAVIGTYQRRPAREETSGRRSEEEQPRETPRQRAGEDVDSPARSAVGPPRRRRRLLIDEEPEEEEDVFFTPMDARPSSGQPDTPAEVDDSERERKERKRRGKPSLSQ
ncbi:neurofilament medium polypeptide-like [Salvia splendens]|uniref:neurofilament medium polypeptide-like n=1 Tax=Salvia splendens TaxID=180675 RepID=UPI001C272D68|nr:neurofilament medium polypeptide-like [Salvia splendens]